MYICGKYRVRVEDIVINYFWAAVKCFKVVRCLQTCQLLHAVCRKGGIFEEIPALKKKKKKINMIYDSNLCFADVNALVLTVKKKKDIKTSEGGKAGQFIVQKQ